MTYSSTYQITESDIEWAAAHGACQPALKWLRAAPRTWGDLPVEYRYWLSRNPNTPPDVLTILATDSNLGVWWGVSWNPNTPPAVLAQQAADLDFYVRYGVERNPNTPKGTL